MLNVTNVLLTKTLRYNVIIVSTGYIVIFFLVLQRDMDDECNINKTLYRIPFLG
jgi:hypothetical protein